MIDSEVKTYSPVAPLDSCTRKACLMCHVQVQPTAPALLGPHAAAQAVVACSVNWLLASFKRGCIVLALCSSSMYTRARLSTDFNLLFASQHNVFFFFSGRCVCVLVLMLSYAAQFFCVLVAIVFVTKQGYFESENSQESCVVNSCTPKADMGACVFSISVRWGCACWLTALWASGPLSVAPECSQGAHVLIVIVSLKIITYERDQVRPLPLPRDTGYTTIVIVSMKIGAVNHLPLWNDPFP